MDAYKCESGRLSITKQIMALGKSVLVIGKDSKGYGKEDWWKSDTFRQCRQENLLISDNQTRAYAEGDARLQMRYSYSAWGEKANTDITALRGKLIDCPAAITN